MEFKITQNTFGTYTGPPTEADTTIFFISGNPGLIGYYHPFLSLLASNLADPTGTLPKGEPTQNISSSFQIYGCSLGGFEIDDGDQYFAADISGVDGHETRNDSKRKDTQLFDLEDQIQFVHRKLTGLMDGNIAAHRGATGSTRTRKVILIGHSVGAYIAMEIVRRHREAGQELSTQTETLPVGENDFDIVGGVMLFPTVMDIAVSPSGQKLTTLLSFIPRLALVVSFFARLLTFLLPATALRSLIRFVMKDPPSHALDTTLTFLRSSGGVRQALHMAADEMRTITSDRWTDDVWGVAVAREPITKLFFYFGRHDHWVAEKTREEIIALRGGQKDGAGPRMLVCEDGLPHAFCLKHSGIMARKVAGMIREIGSS